MKTVTERRTLHFLLHFLQLVTACQAFALSHSNSPSASTSGSSEVNHKVPITLLSGFLGSGKTSFLQHLLQNSDGVKIGVVVNDVASVNIDSKLVHAHNGIVELQNGCACCSLADDLLTSVLALLDCSCQSLDAVVVELSGVADPKAIQSNWRTAKTNAHPVTAKAELSQVVTLIDASTSEKLQGNSWDQLLVEQIEAANVVLINKLDLASQNQAQMASSLVQSLNEQAKILQVQYGRANPSTIVPHRPKIVTTKQHEDVSGVDNVAMDIDDIDQMSLEELKALLLDLNKPTLPKDMTLPQARDLVWDCLLQPEQGESNDDNKLSPTSLDQLGITSFVYKAGRPFDPQKLQALLHQSSIPLKKGVFKEQQQIEFGRSDNRHPFGGVLRSKGFCWLADPKDDTVNYWSHAGKHFDISAAGKWRDAAGKEEQYVASEFGQRRQEIVFIGSSMDQERIIDALNICLVDISTDHL